ncbi:hypothetical protein [Actinomadura macrotermitis]|nr:hypothetical protein [Actinomadura macrotermitis]
MSRRSDWLVSQREPPGPILIVLSMAVCAVEVFAYWNLGGYLRSDILLLALGSVVLLLICLVKTGLAYKYLHKPWRTSLQGIICSVLLIGGLVAMIGELPMKVRFTMSKPSLDAYVRALDKLPVGKGCDSTKFTERRVGQFTVTCAERTTKDIVALTLAGDPWTPRAQMWILAWSENPDLATQHRLSYHWFFELDD